MLQSELESALGLTFGFPTVAVLSAEKKVFAVQRISWSKKNVQSFLNGVLSGRYGLLFGVIVRLSRVLCVQCVQCSVVDTPQS